ncbi:unnamed protein product [Coffea canephora]|uniref:Uncharacterized protein n=1 Tax=Coffea canephora TaxID=49390 RepID=A0A068U4W9_COFCA|nr:unnamed protein product [Coffea canephora]
MGVSLVFSDITLWMQFILIGKEGSPLTFSSNRCRTYAGDGGTCS